MIRRSHELLDFLEQQQILASRAVGHACAVARQGRVL